MSAAELTFVLPAELDRPTGGNIYGRELVRALQRADVPVRVLHLETALVLEPAAARAPFWVDSVYIPDAPLLRVPYGLIVHYFPGLNPALDNTPREAARRREDEASSRAQGFLVTSEFSRAVLCERGYGNRPCLVVPPALSFPPVLTHANADRLRALMVANLVPGKGVRELLEELAGCAAPEVEFQLEIVGRTDLNPDYAAACLRLTQQHPWLRANVRLLGEQRGDRLRRCYRRSNLFVSASGMESYGMALAEARACGLPIIALAGGNVSAHVRPEAGGLCLPDLADLAAALVELARSPALLVDLLEAARISRPHRSYTWDDAAQDFLLQLQRFGLFDQHPVSAPLRGKETG